MSAVRLCTSRPSRLANLREEEEGGREWVGRGGGVERREERGEEKEGVGVDLISPGPKANTCRYYYRCLVRLQAHRHCPRAIAHAPAARSFCARSRRQRTVTISLPLW